MLDDTDRRLLRHLQAQPTQSVALLAESAGLPKATAARRLERLRERGVIRGVRGGINWKALGFAVDVSLRVTLDKTDPRCFDAFLAAARTIPEVTEIQTFLGRVDVRLTVIARDMGDYHRLYRDHILTLPHIADIEALMQVTQVHSRARLPI